jgi:hypothetical protein
MSNRLAIFFFLLVNWAFNPIIAQITTPSDSVEVDSIDLEKELIDERNKPLGDTTGVYYYHSEHPGKLFFIDTTLNQFEYPRRAWGQEQFINTSDLGHLGSPIFNYFPQSRLKAGFRIGLDAFFYYRLKEDEILNYIVNKKRPFTDLYFSQIDIQNVILRARFAHQVSPGLYYSIYYGLLNYNGFYKNHRSRHQDIALNVRYSKKNYALHACFINNANNQSENGGLTSSDINNVSPLFLINLPVQLNTQSDASPKNENRHQYLSIKNFWQNTKRDSSSNSTDAKIELSHQFVYENNIYKFFDNNPAVDSSFYGVFQTNNRGIRHYIRHQVVENEISYKQALSGNLSNSHLVFKLMFSHRWNIVLQEPEFFNIHNFFLGSEIYNSRNSPLYYKVAFKATNSRNGLDFFIKSEVSYLIKNILSLGGQLIFQRYEADQISRKLFISKVKVWENNQFSQNQEFRLNAFIAWPKWWGKLEFNSVSFTNPIYFDSIATARQLSGTVSLFQIALKQDFHFWKIHLENQMSWQKSVSGSDIFRFPQFLFFHSLYFESKVIKNLRFRTGINLRYTTAYKANAYFPLTGKFYLQNNQELTFYPVMDLFLSAKIWQLRFFANAENLSYFLFKSENYYNAPYYPSPNWFIRLGISWQLFD